MHICHNFFQESLIKTNYHVNLFSLLFEMLKDTEDKIRLCTFEELDKFETLICKCTF